MGLSEAKLGSAQLASGPSSRWLAKTAMAALSLLAALAICELGLRFFHPKYESLSQSQRYRADTSRIWAPMPNTATSKAHPDIRRYHPVIYNEFGSRQHRSFSVDALEQAENVAFFGDSYTENTGLDAPYSFTEPLDFLLNLHDRAFNVLNFGLDGYGPGQQFIWYQQFPNRGELARVAYVFCDNDIQNFHDHGLFSLDDAGDLVANVAYQRPLPITLLSRFHLTYLALDAVARWNLFRKTATVPTFLGAPAPAGEPLYKIQKRVMRREQQGTAFSGDEFDDSIAAFQALLLHWKAEVEAQGHQFHVVVLPYMRQTDVDRIIPASLDVLYLEECFSRLIPNYDYSDWRFRDTDAHWNEAGNMVAAHCLYRFLEEETGLPRLFDIELTNARYEYYQAIATSNWMPPTAWAKQPARNAHDPAEISAKYMMLDHRRRMFELIDGSEPVIHADWEIHWISDQQDGTATLTYAKTPCRSEDRANTFFLHVTPRQAQSLPADRSAHGYDNLDFGFGENKGLLVDDRCVVSASLPSYPIARIRTGQFTGGSILELTWEVEFAVGDLSNGQPSLQLDPSAAQ